MDNFESINTYQSSRSTNTSSPAVAQTHDIVSKEITINHEVETPIINNEQAVEPEKVDDTRKYADSILEYSKKNGLLSAFEKLANGEDFDEPEMRSEFADEERLSVNQNNRYEKFDINKNVETDPEEPERRSIIDYLSPELARDNLYTQKLGEVAGEMISEGRELDPETLKEEAFKRYIEEKNSDLPPTLEGKISAIEEEFSQILQENDELRKELEEFKSLVKSQAETLGKMAEAMLALAKKLHQEKEDEEEKITLFELMVRLMAVIMQEMVSYEDRNEKQANKEKSNNGKRVLELPNIKISKDKQSSSSVSQKNVELPKVDKS